MDPLLLLSLLIRFTFFPLFWNTFTITNYLFLWLRKKEQQSKSFYARWKDNVLLSYTSILKQKEASINFSSYSFRTVMPQDMLTLNPGLFSVLCSAVIRCPRGWRSTARRADPTWPKAYSKHRHTWEGCEVGGAAWEGPGAVGRLGSRCWATASLCLTSHLGVLSSSLFQHHHNHHHHHYYT